MKHLRHVIATRRAALPCSLLLCATLALLTATPHFAQQPINVGLQGAITGASGKPVSNAIFTATNLETGAASTAFSDRSGNYVLTPLQPGNYNIEVFAKGFQELLKENIKVDPGLATRLNLRLKVGAPYMCITFSPVPCQMKNDTEGAAAVPLFRDPIHDGAADPVVVWNRARKTWWMLYTNRRADLAGGGGVAWVHGTRIGIAESADGGAHWQYVSEAYIPVPAPDYTLWAPEVIYTGGLYHMFLTVVPGTFTDWNHPRHILHLTSKDLLHWKPLADANLESDRTIDACVFQLKDGTWRLWYKNEADSSEVYFSDSPDLVHWTPKGIATTNHGEGPVVFQWRGAYWLINDPHAGLAVFRSSDLTTWQQQPQNLLSEPGAQPTDRAIGQHPDVVVDGSGRAWLFYFTQQGGADAQGHDPGWSRRSVLHVTELHEANGVLTVDRNAPAHIHMLPPPINKKSDMAGEWSVNAKDGAQIAVGTTPSTSAPIRVSSGTMAANLISKVDTIIPKAFVGEVRGAVVLRAVISKQGEVTELTVITGPVLLRTAVIDAVKQWKYKPYVVNGQPMDVETSITVIID
jgi:hypothetical protein